MIGLSALPNLLTGLDAPDPRILGRQLAALDTAAARAAADRLASTARMLDTGCHIGEQAIEDFAAAVVAIESEIQHGAQEASALRDAESVGAF